MPSIDYKALKSLIPVPRALALLSWRAYKSGGANSRGPCPVHNGKGGSFSTFTATSVEWYCHKCKRGGSVLDLWMRVKGLPLYAAALDLCRAAGVEPPRLPRDDAGRAARDRTREEAL
jgi:DNA primase